MNQHWKKPLPEERFYRDEQAMAEGALSPFNRHARAPLQGEQLDQYDRALTYEVQKVAPNYRDVNLYEANGDAYKRLKEQAYADARREALNPTDVPDGELRQVTRYDHAGRPSYVYFGKCSAWLDQFAYPKKRLAGIFAPDLANMKKV